MPLRAPVPLTSEGPRTDKNACSIAGQLLFGCLRPRKLPPSSIDSPTLTVVKRGRAKRDYDRTPTSSEVRVCIAVRARLASSPRPRHAVRFQITSSRCTFHRRDPFQPHREGGIGKDWMIENRRKCKVKLLSSVGRDSCTSAGFQG